MGTDYKGSRSNSPMYENIRAIRKSPNSLEDLNKEIERLFVDNDCNNMNNKHKTTAGRRAPIAEMLYCYKGQSRRKKRRSDILNISQNCEYESSDSSNEISSDHSCGENCTKCSMTTNNISPIVVVPLPGKFRSDQIPKENGFRPIHENKLKLSSDSAFAPIKSSHQFN